MSDFARQIKRKTIGLFACMLFLLPPAWAVERETPVVLAVRKVGPAVVNISSQQEMTRAPHPFGRNPFFDSFFRDFFEPQPQQHVSLGSGVIIDGRRGFILTNAHVIERAADIKVVLQDERQFDVTLVGVDADSDLAVLRIDSDTPLPMVDLGDSDDILIGETIIAIGNPFGFSHTVTTGVISAVNRSIKTDQRVYHNFIQTDASINPGNSGGPLLNIKGELIGINTAIYAKAQGIGFAIPINTARRIVSDLIQYGHVVQAWIGLTVQELDSRMAEYLNTREVRGVVVTQVEEGSPAAKAGISVGDVIVSLNQRKTVTPQDYTGAARTISAGETVMVTRWREGRASDMKIQTAAYPRARAPELAWRRLGVRVSEFTPELRRRHRIANEKGIVITEVRPESYLARVGAAPGDVIVQFEDQRTLNAEDFISTLIKSRLKSSVLVLLQRDAQIYSLTVPLTP
ncbi:MAG: Do family serine endopeptidase [Desulfatitalea sp.]|nr:Do family serine endopeptidase [Desulfatitalea sp.]